ncbi:MAG: trypsin-like peptidase domain-containing protein [Planctomycetes bacterium]|nr:trypsin-like peptidase domain-containing protein [Planctomycetota bacterium]
MKRIAWGLCLGIALASSALAHPDEYLLPVRRVRPSVVFISVDKGMQVVNGQSVPNRGLGSGVIVDRDGTILTNAHVVEGARTIRVQLEDRREFDATLVGADPATDVAVIRIPGSRDLPVAAMGDSNALEVGQKVVAVGNPMGLGFTVTTGIVSAINRSTGSTEYRNFIQTDAAINPGNSGGPLADLEGRVIGINTFIMGARAPNGGAQSAGLGFAIPVNLCRSVMESLVEGGISSRTYLGVALTDIDQTIAREYGLRRIEGCRVDAVTPSSPAQAAGVRAQDVLLRVEDVVIENSQHLRALLAEHGVGARVRLAVARKGEPAPVSITVALGADPDAVFTTYGFVVEDQGGKVRVTAVSMDSPASKAGLQAGDALEAVGNVAVASVAELRGALSRVDVARDRPRLRGSRREGAADRAIYAVLDATK